MNSLQKRVASSDKESQKGKGGSYNSGATAIYEPAFLYIICKRWGVVSSHVGARSQAMIIVSARPLDMSS